MTEAEARAVVLVRAYEAAPSVAWTETDAAWADGEALRVEGERAPFERWLARRADLAARRIVAGDSTLRRALRATRWPARYAWALALAAFALGFAGEAASGAQRINLLAPPLLALLCWNLAIYTTLVLRRAARGRGQSWGPLRKTLHAITRAREMTGAPGQFIRDWALLAAPLYAARVAALLHVAAFVLAAGALLSLYLRGIAFEFRAGWDSTFLDADRVPAIVSTVLGPASHLSGIALPAVSEFDGLRFARGPGENAAPWIHLHAITIALFVLVPRALLALAAAWQARNLAHDFALPLDDDDFRGLRLRWSMEPVVVHVLPYSYALPAERCVVLERVLQRVVAPRATLRLGDTVPLGGEDDLAAWLARTTDDHAPVLCALFPLTATPEREQHGAFVQALAAHAESSSGRLVVLIDESGFRERFGSSQFDERLAQRRAAWEALLRDVLDRASAPVFTDLDETRGSSRTRA